MTEPGSRLGAALALVQAKLPPIAKTQTATVRSDKGNYSYTYAGLAEISAHILPLLGENGLSWITKPMLVDDGRLVLEYKLLHVSGEFESGQYPLPSSGTPQQIGSAITYARRYTLCSVTGVAPEQDDDDGAAASAAPRRAAQRKSRQPAEPVDEVPDVPLPPETDAAMAAYGHPGHEVTDADPWAAADRKVAEKADGYAELVDQARAKEDLQGLWESARGDGLLSVRLGPDRDHVTLQDYFRAAGQRVAEQTQALP